MSVVVPNQNAVGKPQEMRRILAVEPRWSLAFLGILGYLVIEYTRLPAMYRILIPLQLGKVVTLVALLGFVVSPHARSANWRTLRRVDVGLAVFVLSCLLSCFLAPYQDFAWQGFRDVVLYALVCFLIGRAVNSRWRVAVFLGLYFLLNLKFAQFVIRSRATLSGQGESSLHLSTYGVGAGSTGFFANSADFGVAMCVAWPIAGYLLLAESKSKLRRFALLIFTVSYLVALLVCGSRGAVVGAAAIAAAALLKNPRRITAAVMFLLFLLGLFVILPAGTKQRLESAEDWQQDKTASHRVYLWKAGLLIFRDNPVLGVGVANYPLVRLNSYAIPGSGDVASVAHSTYIQVLAELGTMGTLSWLFLIFCFLRLNTQTRQQLLATDLARRRSWEYGLAFGLDLALIGYLASGAFVSVLFYPHFWVLLGLSVGLNTACAPPKAEFNGAPSTSRIPLNTFPMTVSQESGRC